MNMYHYRPLIELLDTTFNIKIWENVMYTKVIRRAQATVSLIGGCNRFYSGRVIYFRTNTVPMYVYLHNMFSHDYIYIYYQSRLDPIVKGGGRGGGGYEMVKK